MREEARGLGRDVRMAVAPSWVHVAVIRKPHLERILSGEKTIESRIGMTRRAPFGRVSVGERLYLKESGGPVRATAVVARVLCEDGLTPERVEELAREFTERICATPAYWEEKLTARCATLLWLTRVEQVRYGPEVPRFHGEAWACLPAERCVYPECLI